MRDLGLGRPDHPRGVRRHRPQRAGLPPRRRLPASRCSTSAPWAEAAFQHFLRNPLAPAPAPQVQDQLLRLRHRLRPGDVQRRRRDRRHPHARRRHRSSPASGCSSPAASAPTRTRRWRSRSSPPREDLLPTIEAILRVFDQTGNRDNKLRARMKWVVDTLGFDEVQRRVLKERHFLLGLVDVAGRHPRGRRRRRRRAGRRRRRRRRRPPIGQGTPVALSAHATPTSAGTRPTSCAASPRAPCRPYAYARARRHHLRPVPGARLDPARARRRRAASPTARTSCSAASPRRSCRRCTTGSRPSAWPSPAPSWPATSSPAPAPTPATSPSPSPAAWPTPSASALEEAGLAEVGGVRTNISGCTNSCGQHHIADIGFFGAERRAHGQSAPGYQMLLGGYVGQEQIHFGEQGAAPAGQERARGRRAGRRAGSPTSARPARRSAAGWTASGGAKAIADDLARPRRVPDARRERPSSTSTTARPGPYVAEIGESECAT